MSNVVRFGDVVRKISEKVDPVEDGIERYIAGGHMNSEDLKLRRWGEVGDGYLGPAFHRLFKPGQILFGSRRTYLRKCALADFEGVCANTSYVLEAIPEKIHPPLLPFIMQSEPFVQYTIVNSRGSTNPYINWGDIADYEFPLPPLDEQRRIAEVLWAVEDAMEAWFITITDQKMFKRVLLKQFYDLEDCSTIPLGEVGEWLSGGTPSRKNENYWNGDIPWASPKDMKVDVLNVTEEWVTELGAESGTRLVPPDTIFVVTRGMILAHTFPVAMAGREMTFNQDMRALIPSSAFLPKFIFYWFQYNAPKILHTISEASHGTKRLPSEVLYNMKVPCLTQEEQIQIVEVLDKVDQQRKQTHSHIDNSKRLKHGLLQEMLSSDV